MYALLVSQPVPYVTIESIRFLPVPAGDAGVLYTYAIADLVNTQDCGSVTDGTYARRLAAQSVSEAAAGARQLQSSPSANTYTSGGMIVSFRVTVPLSYADALALQTALTPSGSSSGVATAGASPGASSSGRTITDVTVLPLLPDELREVVNAVVTISGASTPAQVLAVLNASDPTVAALATAVSGAVASPGSNSSSSSSSSSTTQLQDVLTVSGADFVSSFKTTGTTTGGGAPATAGATAGVSSTIPAWLSSWLAASSGDTSVAAGASPGAVSTASANSVQGILAQLASGSGGLGFGGGPAAAAAVVAAITAGAGSSSGLSTADAAAVQAQMDAAVASAFSSGATLLTSVASLPSAAPASRTPSASRSAVVPTVTLAHASTAAAAAASTATSSSSGGAIIGAVVGSLAVVSGVGVWMWLRRHRRSGGGKRAVAPKAKLAAPKLADAAANPLAVKAHPALAPAMLSAKESSLSMGTRKLTRTGTAGRVMMMRAREVAIAAETKESPLPSIPSGRQLVSPASMRTMTTSPAASAITPARGTMVKEVASGGTSAATGVKLGRTYSFRRGGDALSVASSPLGEGVASSTPSTDRVAAMNRMTSMRPGTPGMNNSGQHRVAFTPARRAAGGHAAVKGSGGGGVSVNSGQTPERRKSMRRIVSDVGEDMVTLTLSTPVAPPPPVLKLTRVPTKTNLSSSPAPAPAASPAQQPAAGGKLLRISSKAALVSPPPSKSATTPKRGSPAPGRADASGMITSPLAATRSFGGSGPASGSRSLGSGLAATSLASPVGSDVSINVPSTGSPARDLSFAVSNPMAAKAKRL